MSHGQADQASPSDGLEDYAEAAEAFLRSIANRHRLLVLATLAAGEMSAGELSRRLGLTQSNLSRHLAMLREEGLVATRRAATTIHYRVASARALMILEALQHMFGKATPTPDNLATRHDEAG